MPRYWLTPPELAPEREGRFDPCPYPKPVDWDALTMPWSKPWYANPPFATIVKFVRRAVDIGGPGTLVFPVTTSTNILLRAGARLEPLGRVHWIDADTGARDPKGNETALARLS